MRQTNRREILLGSLAVAGCAHGVSATDAPTIWRFDNLQRIGGNAVSVAGAPNLIDGPGGRAIAFDGVDDGLFIDNHPLAGASTFTFEAIFRPDGGAFEQRWFHLESTENPPVDPGRGTTRMLFEIRVVESHWYLDAFTRGPGYNLPLIVPEKLFPVGVWHHVAQSYDGQTYRSFVNGELQAEGPLAFTPQGPGRSSVGVRMNRVNYFHGAVREARFTRAALAPAQFSRILGH